METADREVINELRTTLERLETELADVRERLSLLDGGPLDLPTEIPSDIPVVDLHGGLDLIDIQPIEIAQVPAANRTYQWELDMPGSEVANIISAISLNDRVLFINSLFSQNPDLFQSTVAKLNTMEYLDQAVEYLHSEFPDWKMGSETVYRFMMAVRRKLK